MAYSSKQESVNPLDTAHWEALVFLVKNKKYEQLEVYLLNSEANLIEIIQALAFVNNNPDMITRFKKHGAIPDFVLAEAYARGKHCFEIWTLFQQKKLTIDQTAHCFLIAEDHDSVKKCLAGGANVHLIAREYAAKNDHSMVKVYSEKHRANPESILRGYIQANNHQKVEEYRLANNFSYRFIARIYKEETATINNYPHFYRAINKLEEQKSLVSSSIIDTLIRLNKDQHSWNPLSFINSKMKLNQIVNAVLKLDDLSTLKAEVHKSNSDLHKALNIQRLVPITFFGLFDWRSNQARALIEAEEAANKIELVR